MRAIYFPIIFSMIPAAYRIFRSAIYLFGSYVSRDFFLSASLYTSTRVCIEIERSQQLGLLAVFLLREFVSAIVRLYTIKLLRANSRLGRQYIWDRDERQ